MVRTGVVSVSFRNLSVDEIIRITKESGLGAIEWGSDVHAPKGDAEKLEYIKMKMDEAGLYTSSYGTYFRIGETPIEELYGYISAAKILGTNVLRLWCGRKNYEDMDDNERKRILEEAAAVAKIAENERVILGIECHVNTFTSQINGALSLIRYVDSPSFRMYWQPLINGVSNLEYASAIAPYAVNLHVFNWSKEGKHPLAEGLDAWREYLSFFNGTQHLLLEFMPDGLPKTLAAEAKALFELIKTPIVTE